jgi:nucleotide sugar dehydrogenase
MCPRGVGGHRRVIGLDISEDRLRAIKSGDVDLTTTEHDRLAAVLADGGLELTTNAAELGGVDAVIICVPTPITDDHIPDLRALRAACAGVVAHARPGQTIILTSTSFPGTTSQLLVEPLERRRMRVGRDVFVAFSGERIDPGNHDHVQSRTPRVVGGVTPACAARAARVVACLTEAVYLVGSTAAAELVKLYENVFRAVSLALANEIAEVCGGLGLDPIEVTLGAATKPYGFLGAFPGPGVGGHCIPCDPHYLLWQLHNERRRAPLIEQAMRQIAERPLRVVERAGEVLADTGLALAGARVLVVGASYKAGVRDTRESPALPIMAGLLRAGARVGYVDPLLPEVRLPDGAVLRTDPSPRGADWDLSVIHVLHPGHDYSWVRECPRILDATYQFDSGDVGEVV